MEERFPQTTARVQRALESGAKLAGALAGAATTAVTGDPLAGAAAGWGANEVLAASAREVIERVTERSGTRAAAAVSIIGRDWEEHRAAGDDPRSDGFFDGRGSLRPEAAELLEAVLLAAANSFEEAKLPFLAHLWDGVAHDQAVSAAEALFLTRVADQLTFRQLVALAVFADHEAHFRVLIRAETRRKEGRADPDASVLRELDDLGARGLLGVVDSAGRTENPAGLFGGGSVSTQGFGQIRLTAAGESLYRLMRLSQIPTAEVERWVAALAAGATPS